MIVILCVDDNMGMMFNKRRQSRDSEVMEDVLKYAKTIWIHPFSEMLFGNVENKNNAEIIVDENFLKKAEKGEHCFVENQELMSYSNDIEQIIIYCWNRKYPSDFKLDLDLNNWEPKEVVEFVGHSHEKITKTILEKAGTKNG